MDVIVLSDSDEDYKPFDIGSKKRTIDSDSEDEYKPWSGKGKKQIKIDTTSGTSKESEKCPAAPKERKPRTVTKRNLKKTKAFKEESKNEVGICVSVVKLDVHILMFWHKKTWIGAYLLVFWRSLLLPFLGLCVYYH